MSGTGFQPNFLSDARLAAQALSPSPAWLWSVDGEKILWANPAAAAIFETPAPAAAAQIVRLAGTLPQGGAPRLERLRGFGANFGGVLTCLCSRIALADDTPAVLVVATERGGRDLSLPERARRLLKDIDRPAAIFSTDGEPIEIAPAARECFGNDGDLVAIGAEKLAREAMLNGRADGEIAAGPVTVLQLGAGNATVLLVALGATQSALAETPSPADNPAPAPVAETPEAVPDPIARRFPFRFVWQMDAAGRLAFGSNEFVRLLGPKTAAALKRPWAEAADTLGLDPQGEIAAAIAARSTWSGITVHWPLDDFDERLPVDMSGLPVFDRERQFIGYRGFGFCRDVNRLAAIEQIRPPAEPEAEPFETQEAPTATASPSSSAPAPALTPSEHSNFQELAQALGERLKRSPGKAPVVPDDFGPESVIEPTPEPRAMRNGNGMRDVDEGRPILDRLPVGILVYRLNTLIYANRAFLDWTGYPDLMALGEAGGLDSLFIETGSARGSEASGGRALTIATVNGDQKPVSGRLFSVPWSGESALVLMISTHLASKEQAPAPDQSLQLQRLEAANRDLKAMLDTATDGVLMLDATGRVLSANRSAEALFGREWAEFAKLGFSDLFAPESRGAVLDDLKGVAQGRGAGTLNAGREAIGLVGQGGLVPLYVTLGRLADGENFCAVLRDLTARKRAEEEQIAEEQEAELPLNIRSDFLAKVSHEIRTPLNAIVGFSEVMRDERFGPLGNERYKKYLDDIHSSGVHLLALLSDMLDLSKIEAGTLNLSFDTVDLNELVQQCVATTQPKANREHVIIRTSLPPGLPAITADARTVRQIVLNLLSSSIKFTMAGGQVIVSTASTNAHEVVLRVRDTGIGMSERELRNALEPFGQVSTSARASGSGLSLPISKALAEANHGRFNITSQINDGTLVEVAFPAARVLAQ